MSSPSNLPLEFQRDIGIAVTHQFTLLSGVYKFQVITESSDYSCAKLYDPKGYRELIFNDTIKWRIIVDEAFDM